MIKRKLFLRGTLTHFLALMRRFSSLSLPLLLLGLILSFSGCHPGQKVLYIYNWAEYVPLEILDEFTKKTGIRVVYDTFESEEILETELYMASTYDLVFASAWPSFGQAVASNLFQPLKREWIPHFHHLDPLILKKMDAIDPHNRFGVPYLFGSVGIGVNVEKAKALLPNENFNTWGIIFNPTLSAKLSQGRIYCCETAKDVFQSALLYMKEDPCSQDPAVWDKAFQVIMNARPFIARFENSRQIENLLEEQAIVIQGHSDCVKTAQERGISYNPKRHIRYFLPQEGAIMWCDMMAIPKKARNPYYAHVFINFLLQPHIMARVSNQLKCANGVPASLAFIDPELKKDETIFPSKETIQRMRADFLPSLALLRHIYELWLQIRSNTKAPTGRPSSQAPSPLDAPHSPAPTPS